jgi:phosphoenolpyruvate synthase/pyruvate phosphate dikinase
MMRKIDTKANVLKRLKISNAKIPFLISFTEKDFLNRKKKILNKIAKIFKRKIAIRSSNASEDQEKKSFAGYFRSFLNINAADKNSVEKHIIQVFKSYKKYKNKKNEVIIQNMVEEVNLSGVATSCDKDYFSPYFIVNFLKSRDTSKITSGNLNGSTFVFYSKSKILPRNWYLRKIIFLIRKLEKIYGNAIDLEFAFDKNKKLNLLQVRKVVKNKNYKNIYSNFLSSFTKLSKKIKKLKKEHYNLYGKTTMFGVMPDWNPAEIVGIKPNNLAISLYQELITDHIWAYDRKKFGYKDVTSHHLLTNFYGTPFVDVRVDFNSWMPKELNQKTSEKLVNYYLNAYKRNTELHDKIEFNIIFSCFTFSTDEKLKKLLKYGFKKKEIKKISFELKKITNKSFDILEKSLLDSDKLINSQKSIIESDIYEIDKIYWLIEDCKKFGTPSFASVARCAFIANDFLNSLVEKNILTKDERLLFLSSIKTVVSEMNLDLDKLTKFEFIKKYGHLRPSTYDINSINYEEGYNVYFANTKKIKRTKKTFRLKNWQKKSIKKLLKINKLNISTDKFINFIKKAVAGREKAKFYFSKNIDLVFKMLNKIGSRNNIKKKDLCYLDIKTILDFYYNLELQDIEKKLKNQIKENKESYQKNNLIKLPKNLIYKSDVFFFTEKFPKSNFVGSGDTTGNIIHIDKITDNKFENKIVCIASADPGYDYIFSRKIKGLITMFGGINSHMAIRCSELGIPAAIGVGERMFNEITNSRISRLNAISEKIDIIA